MKNRKTISIILFSMISIFCFGQDTIYLTKPALFTEMVGSVMGYSLTALSPERFVVGYDNGMGYKGQVRIGNIHNDTIVAFGNPFTFTSDLSLHGINVTRLTNTRFVLTFSTNYCTTIQVCEVVKEDSLLMGSPFVLKKDNYDIFSVASINDSKFLIAYYDGNSDYGKCALGKINENLTITTDAIYSFTSSYLTNTSYVSVDTLSKSKFVIAYGYWGGNAVIGSIDSNDKVTFGKTCNFTSKDAYYMDVVGLNENSFAVVYTDDYYTMKGAVILGSVNENNLITYSSKYFFNDKETRGIAATKLSCEEMIIAYNNSTNADYNGYLIKANLSNNTVHFAEKVLHNPAVGINSYNPLSALNNQKFIVLYPDGVNNAGYIRFGSTVDFTSPTSTENNWNREYSIYPNPATDQLYIQMPVIGDNVNVKIVNLMGTIVYNRQHLSDKILLKMNNFPRGMYIVQAESYGKIITEKIILE